MKLRFELKANKLDKKWLKSIRDFFDGETISITIKSRNRKTMQEWTDFPKDDALTDDWLKELGIITEKEEQIVPELEAVSVEPKTRKKRSPKVEALNEVKDAPKTPAKRGRKPKVEAISVEEKPVVRRGRKPKVEAVSIEEKPVVKRGRKPKVEKPAEE